MVLKRAGARAALRLSPEEPVAAESYREKEGGPEEATLGELGGAGPMARVSPANLLQRRRWRLSNSERACVLRTCWRLQLLRGRPGRPGPRFWRASPSPFLRSSAEALPPAWASTRARRGRLAPLWSAPSVSQAPGHKAERPPPRADPLPGRPKLPEIGGGGWQRGRERAPAVKPRGDKGGAIRRVSSALKFGNTVSCYLEDKGQPALEVYSLTLTLNSMTNNYMQVFDLHC